MRPNMRSDSSSSISSFASITSRRLSIESEPMMQIFVRDLAGNTFPLSIPQTTSVSTLRSLLALRTNLPETELRLVFAGKHLTPTSEPLTTHHITRESTIHMTLPLRGGMAPKKMRCNFKDCKDAAQRIVGDCGFCQGHFCGKHRMLESHNCPKLEDCKAEEKERNGEKLLSERTVAIKGI